MKNLIDTMGASARLTREVIWDPISPYIPRVRRDFSLLPRPGFVGSNWQSGGYALIGSNGNSTEGRPEASREYEAQDSDHAELIRSFRDGPNDANFRSLMDFERNDILRWSLRSTIDQVLDRLDTSLDDVAVLNVIPFSTLTSPGASSPVWWNSVALHLAPLLNSLQPERIIWLGKAAIKGIRPHAHLLPVCVSHTVSRQRNLSWSEKLNDVPVKH